MIDVALIRSSIDPICPIYGLNSNGHLWVMATATAAQIQQAMAIMQQNFTNPTYEVVTY